MPPVGQTVSILDSSHHDDLARSLNLHRGDLAEADVANLALGLEIIERAERLFERRARVDAMELVEVDAVKPQPAQAHLDALDQVAGAAHVLGFGRSLAGDTALGGDDQARRVGVKRLGDQALGNLRAVGVGGVDQRDAQFDGAAEDAAGFGGVGWLAPGAFAHQAHGSVAETMDGKVAADEEGAAQSGGGSECAHDGLDAVASREVQAMAPGSTRGSLRSAIKYHKWAHG